MFIFSDGDEMDDDGNFKSDNDNDNDYSDPDAAPKSDSDDEEYAADEVIKKYGRTSSKKFKCDLCQTLVDEEEVVFETRIDLINHKTTYHGIIPGLQKTIFKDPKIKKGIYQCDLCSKAPYTTIGALTQHKKKQHGVFEAGKKFQCDLCSKAPYSTKKSLRRHKENTHGAAHLQDSNGKKHSIYSMLEESRRALTTEVVDLSSDNENDTNDQKTSIKIVKLTPKKSPMKKSIGDMASQVRSPVKTNVDGPLKCQFCEYGADKPSNLKNHVLNHFKDSLFPLLPRSKPYLCPDCNAPHRDLITLLRHFSWSHNMFYRFASKEDLIPRPKDQPIRDPKSAKPSIIGTTGTLSKIYKASENSDLVDQEEEKKPKVVGLSSSISRPKGQPIRDSKSAKPSIVKDEHSEVDEEEKRPEVVSLSSSNENSNGSSAVEGSDQKISEDEEEKPEVVSLSGSNENSNGSSAMEGSDEKISEEEEDEVKNENSDTDGEENQK